MAKIKVNVYAADQLTNGNQSEGIQALMDGDPVQISMHSNLIYSSFDPRFNVVSLFVYFKEKVDEKIINYCNVDILDYNAPYVELKWVVDILEKKIIVNGQQPNKLIDIEKA